MPTVTGCPCGETHQLSAAAAAALAMMPPVVPTVSGARGWQVPRTFAACHPAEVRDARLAGSAARYGWNPVEPIPLVREAQRADAAD